MRKEEEHKCISHLLIALRAQYALHPEIERPSFQFFTLVI